MDRDEVMQGMLISYLGKDEDLMLKLKHLEPDEIYQMAHVEGSLDTIYHALGNIYGEIKDKCPAAANYLIDAMGAIDSAVMASVKMFDKK